MTQMLLFVFMYCIKIKNHVPKLLTFLTLLVSHSEAEEIHLVLYVLRLNKIAHNV